MTKWLGSSRSSRTLKTWLKTYRLQDKSLMWIFCEHWKRSCWKSWIWLLLHCSRHSLTKQKPKRLWSIWRRWSRTSMSTCSHRSRKTKMLWLVKNRWEGILAPLVTKTWCIWWGSKRSITHGTCCLRGRSCRSPMWAWGLVDFCSPWRWRLVEEHHPKGWKRGKPQGK